VRQLSTLLIRIYCNDKCALRTWLKLLLANELIMPQSFHRREDSTVFTGVILSSLELSAYKNGTHPSVTSI
jgi:hypothetical protein